MENLVLCEKCMELYESNKEAYESGQETLELCEECMEYYNEILGAEEGQLSTELLTIQRVRKEEDRLEKLYGEIEVEDNSENRKSELEAEALGVFYRRLIAMGLSTDEALTLTSNKQVSEYNIKQIKAQEVLIMENQI